ncbi:hypothetical protein H5410_036045 [Solanum commersonii]|uniref:Gag-pol polyprotein n=1 Tax=Solanum commersonii TaxID=4109 RepID=A0A9J5Y3L3_SOLCO|nr:hypothetical protein H5410_036045 [Solanum commersonii]
MRSFELLSSVGEAMKTQTNREVVGTMASRVRDFTRMNTPEFYDSKVKEDPQEFIDQVYKILMIMRVTAVGKVELSLST